MADTKFPWDELIELMTRDQRVVPIIGPELGVLSSEGDCTFESVAFQQLSQAAQESIRKGRPNSAVCQELLKIHRKALETSGSNGAPEPLRQLAEIRDFQLLLTTAADDLLAQALTEVRGRKPGRLATALNDAVDLPRNWAQGPKPMLFHLFGRISPAPSFALTEEDTIELIHRMQNEVAPKSLIGELRERHLLFLGVNLEDWPMRLLLRLLHGTRLSDDTGQVLVLAGDAVRQDKKLLDFLREVCPRIWIFEEGSAIEFTRQLHKRWTNLQEESWATTTEGELVSEPEPMPEGAVYLSYARADRAAAERFAAVLDEAGLDAWFDRNDPPRTSRYEGRLRQYIQHCDLFVPLLSKHTDAQNDSVVRREWEWASEQSPDSEMRSLIPVVLDADVSPAKMPALFRDLPTGRAPGGQPSPDLLRECIAAVRQHRARHNP